WSEETIAFNLDNAKTPKEKRSGYSVVQVQLENRGKIFFIRMKKQFKKEVDKSTRSGTGRREKWRYFDDMQAICGHRDNITPTVLLESSKDNDHSDHSEGESTNDTESCEIETLSTSRKPKKTKLEKSLKLLCDSFKEATEMEMKQQQKIEEERHKREMEFQWKLRQLEMKRRRKERQHELSVL
ncbi:unnamed protein product, partial [Pocillopora meandrina]